MEKKHGRKCIFTGNRCLYLHLPFLYKTFFVDILYTLIDVHYILPKGHKQKSIMQPKFRIVLIHFTMKANVLTVLLFLDTVWRYFLFYFID